MECVNKGITAKHGCHRLTSRKHMGGHIDVAVTYNLTRSRRGVRSRESRANAGEGAGEEEEGALNMTSQFGQQKGLWRTT
jgi:hypothetical protein